MRAREGLPGRGLAGLAVAFHVRAQLHGEARLHLGAAPGQLLLTVEQRVVLVLRGHVHLCDVMRCTQCGVYENILNLRVPYQDIESLLEDVLWNYELVNPSVLRAALKGFT